MSGSNRHFRLKLYTFLERSQYQTTCMRKYLWLGVSCNKHQLSKVTTKLSHHYTLFKVTTMATYKNLSVCCSVCQKETTTSGLANHFLSVHVTDEGRKSRSKEGHAAAAKTTRLKVLDRNLTKCKAYYQNPGKCDCCGNDKDYFKRNMKYCSQSCAATATNKTRIHSEETKQKIASSIKSLPKTKRVKLPKESHPRSPTVKIKCSVCFHKCSQCDTMIISRSASPTRKTCSRTCQIHASVGNRTYVNGRRLNIYYTTISGETVLLESSWERKLAEHLDAMGIIWNRPKPIKYTLLSKDHLYYPDFYIPATGLYLDPKNPTALKLSLEKMNIVSNQIPLWYGDVDSMIAEMSSIDSISARTKLFVSGLRRKNQTFATCPQNTDAIITPHGDLH